MSSNYLPAVGDELSILSYLGQQDVTIELTKSFKGLVLRQDVSVLKVNPEDAVFRISNIEMSTALEGDVYLHNPLFPKPMVAQFKSLDIRKCMLVLSGFAYIEMELKKRQHERVQPKRPTYVTLRWRGKAQRACVNNISINGIGILAFKNYGREMRIRPGSKVKLEFQLPPDRMHMVLKGTIIYINSIDRYLTSIGVQLFPKAQESRLLKEYIAPRKQEILEELTQAYWELTKPRGTESLYF